MTHDELREKVARVLCQTALGHKKCPCSESGRFSCAAEHPGRMADAAIALVLEEAAKVCETRIESEIDTHGRYFAAAIRALIPKEPSE